MSVQRGLNGASGGPVARADGEVRTQINLPWGQAIKIAMNSLKIRFWRAMITGAGIFLGIAFLCFSGTGLLPHLMGHADPSGVVATDINRQYWLVTMALLVCFVGIMNSMLMSVSERFREIGTMKCLGALNSLIVRLFIIEALFMGIISSFAGWVLGILAFVLVRWASLGWENGMKDMTGPVILTSLLSCVIIGAVITLFAALLPARRAAQMPPAAALRTEV